MTRRAQIGSALQVLGWIAVFAGLAVEVVELLRVLAGAIFSAPRWPLLVNVGGGFLVIGGVALTGAAGAVVKLPLVRPLPLSRDARIALHVAVLAAICSVLALSQSSSCTGAAP